MIQKLAKESAGALVYLLQFLTYGTALFILVIIILYLFFL